MDRNVHLIVVMDDNNSESRAMTHTLVSDLTIPFTEIPIQRVRHILPGIRATPAVGVLLWSDDMQGVASNIAAFAQYIQAQTDYEAAADRALELEYQTAIRELEA